MKNVAKVLWGIMWEMQMQFLLPCMWEMHRSMLSSLVANFVQPH